MLSRAMVKDSLPSMVLHSLVSQSHILRLINQLEVPNLRNLRQLVGLRGIDNVAGMAWTPPPCDFWHARFSFATFCDFLPICVGETRE